MTDPENSLPETTASEATTTRRSVLQTALAMFFGLVATSAFADGDDRKHKKYPPKSMYKPTKSMHIPIGMVVHADADPGTSLQASGHATAGDTVTLTMIYGSPTPNSDVTYTVFFEDVEKSLGLDDTDSIQVTVKANTDIGQTTVPTASPTVNNEVVFVVKGDKSGDNPHGKRYSTNLRIHPKPGTAYHG